MRAMFLPLFSLSVLTVLCTACSDTQATAQSARPQSVPVRAAVEVEETQMNTEVATFGAGCFWGVEHRFRQIPGVVFTEVGYSGGTTKDPTYRDVCSHKTGHAEAVRIRYDPEKLSYNELLAAFFAMHDPTQWHRQGPDVGSQYRSVIFYHTPEQEAAALAAKERLQNSGRYPREIVTEVVPAVEFYRAEDYHQQYYGKRGGGSCNLPGG